MTASVVDTILKFNERDDLIDKNGGLANMNAIMKAQLDANQLSDGDPTKKPNGTRTKTRSQVYLLFPHRLFSVTLKSFPFIPI